MNNHGESEKISGMYVIDLRKKTINAYKESRKKFFIGIVGVVHLNFVKIFLNFCIQIRDDMMNFIK